jgi:hypothetical protein
MLHRFRFVILGTLMILASAGVSYAVVSAAMSPALLPAGTTRYAVAYSGAAYGLDFTSFWQDMYGMTKYISIPAGKTADVLVSFCSQFSKSTGSAVQLRALIRSVVGSPPAPGFELTDPATTHCANFYWTNVAAGQPAIKVQMFVPLVTSVQVYNSTMFVTVNVH